MDNKQAEINETDLNMDFEHYLRSNRKRVNRSLNIILWICILTGPAIALGVRSGVFERTSYFACLNISVSMFIMALANMLVLKKIPYSYIPGLLALICLDILLCYMNASHISIRLTWFLVPVLSLLFCDTRTYIGISVLNYLIMGLGTWLESPFYAQIRNDFETPLKGFINIFAGCTIESVLMFAAGLALGRAMVNYYRRMIEQYGKMTEDQEKMQEQLDILDSMAEIYDFVNLIDFNGSTEMSLREEVLHKRVIEKGQDHTHMTQSLRDQIAVDMLDDFWRFTDITTVPTRLINRRSISGEFISNNTGWFRAQYIRVKGQIDQKPEVVIYTIQNIDADKRREEHLIRISMTDELTRLLNRRCYEEEIAKINERKDYEGLSILSIDVNGLKTVNDTLGHKAGDELIVGAAQSLLSAVGSHGRVYRTGGDEFMMLVYAADCNALIRDIKKRTQEFKGALVDSVSVSAGYASHEDYPDADIAELQTIADRRMYEDKELYYQQNNVQRNR